MEEGPLFWCASVELRVQYMPRTHPIQVFSKLLHEFPYVIADLNMLLI